jgi:hypothetical protein
MFGITDDRIVSSADFDKKERIVSVCICPMGRYKRRQQIKEKIKRKMVVL